MRYAEFLDILLIRGHSRKCVGAFTLVELLVAIAIIATLGAIGVPAYNGYIDRARNATAAADIRDIELRIVGFRAEHARLPDTPAEAGVVTGPDPWGNPYQYTRLEGLDKNDFDAKARWDKHEKPLNWDFDLGSMGKDGLTKPRIRHKDSYDDIIRANGGRYVGLASEY